MDMNNVLTLIGSYGFPIIACIAMFVTQYREREQNRKHMEAITNSHKEEVAQLDAVIRNNTTALLRLVEKMEEK